MGPRDDFGRIIPDHKRDEVYANSTKGDKADIRPKVGVLRAI